MKAVFRCDATAETGLGHLSRCIALAEALDLSGVASTFAGMFDSAARDQIASAGFAATVFFAPLNTDPADRALAEIVTRMDSAFIVVDSYRADERYLANLAAHGRAIVVIDDFRALAAYPCQVVLNFTWAAPSLGYPQGPVLLLGPEYLLVRRRLADLRSRSVERDRRGQVHRLLIAVGGSDPKGITTRLVRILCDRHQAVCVRTIAESHDELAAMMAHFAPESSILPRQPDLSDQLLWADAAITGGGLIKYESAYMGVPAAAIAQNEGQDGETQVLSRAGLVHDLGLADSRSDDDLQAALDNFMADAKLRGQLATCMQQAFVPDPSAHAADAILEALRR